MKSQLWIEEQLDDYLSLKLRVDKTLFSGVSEFQSVDVVETRGHGKMLLNDGLIMCTEKDEFVYHDMISHVPLFTHPHPKKVLIIGGGDGGTAREVLRHTTVEKCVMVEIDKMVVEACIAHIPQTAQVLKGHPKLELIIGDGLHYAQTTTEKFDVILVDSTDPIGPATPLFGPDFYKDIFRILNDDGIVVSQGEPVFYNSENQLGLMKILHQFFPIVSIYNFSNLTYPGGLWSFTYASKKYHPQKDFNPARVKESGLEFNYYNEALHTAVFALPSFQKKLVGPFLKG